MTKRSSKSCATCGTQEPAVLRHHSPYCREQMFRLALKALFGTFDDEEIAELIQQPHYHSHWRTV